MNDEKLPDWNWKTVAYQFRTSIPHTACQAMAPRGYGGNNLSFHDTRCLACKAYDAAEQAEIDFMRIMKERGEKKKLG